MANKNTPSQDSEIVSLLISHENDTVRSILIQDIRVKFEKTARYKKVPRDDVDDVVNGGIEKLLRKLSKFHGKGTFNNWALVLFSNHCMDYFRKAALDRIFVSASSLVKENEEGDGFDFFPGKTPDALEDASNRQQLDRVLSVMDHVIKITAALRRHEERDTEIANLGLKQLLEPNEILPVLIDRFPGLSLNAIRMVLHEFRKALRKELDDE